MRRRFFISFFLIVTVLFLIAGCRNTNDATTTEPDEQNLALPEDNEDVQDAPSSEETALVTEPDTAVSPADTPEPEALSPVPTPEDVTPTPIADPPFTVNLVAGSTIQHKVENGEWLMQIARCYGADYSAVLKANPKLLNPNMIKPGETVSVPNIGSASQIYGPPCVQQYTIQTGDTWTSIAQQFSTTTAILQRANPVSSLVVGRKVYVPAYAGGLQANCFSETLTPQGDICFYFFGKPVENNPTAVDVDTIELSVGLGPALQTIDVPQETASPFEVINLGLVVEDMNYDGYDDFRFIEFLPAGPNIPYLYYIYDPASSQFVFNEAYGPITTPELIGNNEIRSYWRAGAAYYGEDTYLIVEGNPVLTQREEWDVINETEAIHRVTKYDYTTNTSEVILEETGPIP